MGLDNGIVVKGLAQEDAPSFVHIRQYEGQFEVCYYRKCWGIRGEVNALLHLPYDKYECKVDREDLPAIIEILKKYLKPDYYEENAESIWQYDEMVDSLTAHIINLSWLYVYWGKHPDLEVTWYDSY